MISPSLPVAAVMPEAAAAAAATEGVGRGVLLLKARSCSRSTEAAGVDWVERKEGGGELGRAVL
jgi:hypothetical protein